MNQNEQMREAIVAMVEDGWLHCGAEGMSDAQQKVYDAYREITAINCEYCGGNDETPQDHCVDCERPQALAAEPAPNTLGYVQGIEAAAKMLDTKAADYAGEFGFGDMGALEFSREAQREYHSTLIELAEEVRAMVCAKPAQLVRLTQIERDRIATSCQSTQQVISATIDAMIAKNGGSCVM